MPDMTISPVLAHADRKTLRSVVETCACMSAGNLAWAAMSIDDGNFDQAQKAMLAALNQHVDRGSTTRPADLDRIRRVIAGLDGHRYQTCALRATLELLVAAAEGCDAIRFGQRAGQAMQACATLMAERRRLRGDAPPILLMAA